MAVTAVGLLCIACLGIFALAAHETYRTALAYASGAQADVWIRSVDVTMVMSGGGSPGGSYRDWEIAIVTEVNGQRQVLTQGDSVAIRAERKEWLQAQRGRQVTVWVYPESRSFSLERNFPMDSVAIMGISLVFVLVLGGGLWHSFRKSA